MFIKECTYIEHIKEGKETLYIVFIKNPNLNIKKSSEKSQTINDVCYNVCSRNINTSYIQSCHQNKKSTMIIVTPKILENTTGFDIYDADIKGIAYVEPISNDDFNEIHKVINNSTGQPKTDSTLSNFLKCIEIMMKSIDVYLRTNMVHLIDVCADNTRYATMMLAINQEHVQYVSQNSHVAGLWEIWVKIQTFLAKRQANAHLFISDLYFKFANIQNLGFNYCYISLICATKTGGIIIDYLENIDNSLQLNHIGFKYQAIALNGISSAYSFYVHKKFYRSIDGVDFYENGTTYNKEKNRFSLVESKANIYFTGESTSGGYLFVKRVGIPYLKFSQGGGIIKKPKKHYKYPYVDHRLKLVCSSKNRTKN